MSMTRVACSASRLVVALLVVAACGGQDARPASVAPPGGAPKDPPWLAAASEACVRVASCAHGHDAPRLRDPGACVEWWLAHGDPRSPDPLQKCLAVARTCEQVSACMHGGGDARAARFCASRPGVTSGCEGERLVVCGDDDAHESTITDCAALGATCREMRAAGGLVVRACFAPSKCPPGSPEARCDGDAAVLTCHDGGVERVACPPGTKCTEHKDASGAASASCQLPHRRRCDSLGARRCEGDRLVECSGSGHEGHVRVTDCIGFGLRCAGAGPRAGCYVPANVECDPQMLPKCEGGSLAFCAAGRLAKVSCAAMGLGACDPAARGLVAGCTPPGGT